MKTSRYDLNYGAWFRDLLITMAIAVFTGCSGPPGGGGGGTSACAEANASCTGAGECCPGLSCVMATCQAGAGDDQNDCGGAGAACTESSECCLSLTCADGGCQEFPADSFVFDVTYQDNGQLISEATMDNELVEVSDDLGEYRFNGTASEITALEVGDVVLFSGLSLRRITEMSEEDSEIVVATESATLNELIRDGTVAWEYTVDFAELPTPQVDPGFEDIFALSEVESSATRALSGKQTVSAKGFTWSGQINGWDTSFTVDPAGDRLGVNIAFSRSIGGVPVVALTGDGWIGTFRQSTSLTFEDGQLQNAEAWTNELRGEMELKWAAVNQGDFIGADLTLLTIPVGIPFVVPAGPVPITLWLKANGRLTAQLLFPNMSSQGSMKIVYGSSHGFGIEGESLISLGGLGSSDFSITGDTVSAGTVTVGFGAGLEFPRVEVSILGIASAYVSVDTFVAGFFEPGLPFTGLQPCQWAELSLKGQAGYQLSVLGLPLLSDSSVLWRKDFTRYLGGEPCN